MNTNQKQFPWFTKKSICSLILLHTANDWEIKKLFTRRCFSSMYSILMKWNERINFHLQFLVNENFIDENIKYVILIGVTWMHSYLVLSSGVNLLPLLLNQKCWWSYRHIRWRTHSTRRTAGLDICCAQNAGQMIMIDNLAMIRSIFDSNRRNFWVLW